MPKITTETGYELEVDAERGIILINGEELQIRQVHSHIVYLDKNVIIYTRDIYRAIHGGAEPSLDLIGQLLAEELQRQQQERQMYCSHGETSLKTTLPCAYRDDGIQCRVATRKSFIMDNPTIPGAFILLPCCKDHVTAIQGMVAKKAGMVCSLVEDGNIEYPVGQEG